MCVLETFSLFAHSDIYLSTWDKTAGSRNMLYEVNVNQIVRHAESILSVFPEQHLCCMSDIKSRHTLKKLGYIIMGKTTATRSIGLNQL